MSKKKKSNEKKEKKWIYGLLIVVGIGLLGTFAGRLDTFPGTVMFTLGAALIGFSVVRLNK